MFGRGQESQMLVFARLLLTKQFKDPTAVTTTQLSIKLFQKYHNGPRRHSPAAGCLSPRHLLLHRGPLLHRTLCIHRMISKHMTLIMVSQLLANQLGACYISGHRDIVLYTLARSYKYYTVSSH